MKQRRGFVQESAAGMTGRAGLVMPDRQIIRVKVETYWNVELRDPNGDLLWRDEWENLVVNTGLNDLLDKRFKASGYTAADYVGLTQGSPTFAAGDTTSSHGGWTESTAYSEANRQALTLGSVSGGSVSNTASKATFSINGTATLGGGFIVTNNTKGGTTGILYGGGAFSANRSAANGDTLTAEITLTVTAS